MSRPRPNADTIAPRFVYDELVSVEAKLAAVAKVATDRVILDHVKSSRSSAAEARARAKLFLQDVALRTAEQAALFDPTQEVQHGDK